MRLQVIVHEAEEGGFWAEIPSLPGCYTQGETREELRECAKEAAEGYLLAGRTETLPGSESFEIAV